MMRILEDILFRSLAASQEVSLVDGTGHITGHINALIRQAQLPKEQRVKTIIQSSWQYVREHGEKVDLFFGMEATPEEREAFKEFLNGN